jgi:hypothetical protein
MKRTNMPPRPLEYIYPGVLAAQAIHAAVKFGIPDLLGSGPKSAAELASDCGAHAPTLERLLRALTSIELFYRLPDGRYRNSPGTEILRRDHPQALWGEGLFLPARFIWRPLGELTESVRTGDAPFNRVFGQGIFEYLAEHPDDAEAFNQVMAQDTLWTTPALLRAYDFSRFKRLVDVGGGYGVFLGSILSATPKLEGVLFDQSEVIAKAESTFVPAVAERVTLIAGSFFDRVPAGGDVYLLRRIIHDWEDGEALQILANVHDAMTPDGTLLVVEALIDSPTRPAGLMDLMMLVLGGRERTEAEFRKLFADAGFTIGRIIPAGAYSVIECKRR